VQNPALPLGRVAAAATFALASICFAPTATADVRTMIVTSDPQYPWTTRTDARLPESDAERDARSRALIEEQYRSIAAYRAARPGQDIPVFINGDLTAYGHGWQRDVMARLLRILGDIPVTIGRSGLILVLTGTPGTASVIAQAIDESNLREQEGTLAGDNTLLVLFADSSRLERWRERFESIQSRSGGSRIP